MLIASSFGNNCVELYAGKREYPGTAIDSKGDFSNQISMTCNAGDNVYFTAKAVDDCPVSFSIISPDQKVV